MAMIANRRAKLIVVQDIAANKEIQDFISENYEQIGTVADIAVYGLKKELVPVAKTGKQVEPKSREPAAATRPVNAFLAQARLVR